MRKIIPAALIFLVFLISACNAVEKESTYKIGLIYPLTGDAAVYGLAIQKATEIAKDEINAKGINGKKMEFIYEDGKCNAKDSNQAVQKLVNVDKVKIIIGGICSSETLGAAPITEANKVVLLSPASTSPDITNAGDFVFRLAPSDAYAGVVAAEYASRELKAKKAALITESSDYAQSLRKVFKENFIKYGGKIVSDETYNPEDTDFRTQLTKVKASNPDIIYIIPQTPTKGILLVKQIKELGVKQQLLTAEVLIGRDLVKGHKELEGLIGIEQKFDDKAPKTAALLAKYNQQSGQEAPIPTYMSSAYDAVYIVANAILKNGYGSEKIRDYLYSLKDYEGAVGKISIDKNGDVILGFSVKQVKNGELKLLK